MDKMITDGSERRREHPFASVGLCPLSDGEVQYLRKNELLEDDIIESVPRRRKGLYDRILQQKWEVYESKSHEEKDEYAREIAKEMMEKDGVRFLSKTTHPITGEKVYQVHQRVEFSIKQKLKRDIKGVVNENHSRLGFTRQQIEERKVRFKQQREQEKSKNELVMAIPTESSRRQLSLSKERNKPRHHTLEPFRRTPHWPIESHADVVQYDSLKPVSAFEYVDRHGAKAFGWWSRDRQKRGYEHSLPRDVPRSPKYIGTAAVPAPATSAPLTSSRDALEPLHASSGEHCSGSYSLQEHPECDQSLSPLQGHNVPYADFSHDVLNLHDIFEDEDTNSNVTLQSHLDIGKAIGNLSPKPMKDSLSPQRSKQLEPHSFATSICYPQGHPLQQPMLATTTMPPPLRSNPNSAAKLANNPTVYRSRNFMDWRADHQPSDLAGSLNARLLSKLHANAVQQQDSSQQQDLKQEEIYTDQEEDESDKRARSEVDSVGRSSSKRRKPLIGVTDSDTRRFPDPPRFKSESSA